MIDPVGPKWNDIGNILLYKSIFHSNSLLHHVLPNDCIGLMYKSLMTWETFTHWARSFLFSLNDVCLERTGTLTNFSDTIVLALILVFLCLLFFRLFNSWRQRIEGLDLLSMKRWHLIYFALDYFSDSKFIGSKYRSYLCFCITSLNLIVVITNKIFFKFLFLFVLWRYRIEFCCTKLL